MIFVALSEAADKGELLLVEGGLCRWHRRRDGAVVIRELLVLPASRRQGIGRRLVESVARQNPGAVVRAKCPATYAANIFWAGVGFDLAGQTKGVNLWERRP